MKKKLTQQHLKQLVEYDKDTGIFTRLTPYGDNEIGDIIGFINNRGYMIISLRGKAYLAHRLAWLYITGDDPKEVIDHINQIKSDNRFSNLRDITFSRNLRNSSLNKRNKLGVTGVSFREGTKNPYVAKIMVDYKTIHLGRFKTLKKAKKARKKANKKYGFHKNHGKSKI